MLLFLGDLKVCERLRKIKMKTRSLQTLVKVEDQSRNRKTSEVLLSKSSILCNFSWYKWSLSLLNLPRIGNINIDLLFISMFLVMKFSCYDPEPPNLFKLNIPLVSRGKKKMNVGKKYIYTI